MSNTEINNQIGSYLKIEIERRNIAQKQLQSDLGVSQQYVSALINGKKSIGKKLARKLSELYGLDEAVLLGLTHFNDDLKENTNIKNKPHDEQMQILFNKINDLEEEINTIRIRDGLYLEAIAARLGIDVENNNIENTEKEKSGTN